MKVLIATDSFKGSLTAIEAGECIAKGLVRVFPQAEVSIVPVADGGEGTCDAFLYACGGEKISCTVLDPLSRTIQASYVLLADKKTAVVEMAAAAGLPLLTKEERSPLYTSTYGVGQLISAALERLHKEKGAGKEYRPRLILGLGGSATNDAAAGALEALGIIFLDKNGQKIERGGKGLASLSTVDRRLQHPLLDKTEIFLASDVDNPLCGPLGASYIFGPQKGASPQDCAVLEDALSHFAAICKQSCGKDIAEKKGAGAAGGFAAGFLFFTEAQIFPGAELLFKESNFEDRLPHCSFVVTGEGKLDLQTQFGKTPMTVAQKAKKYNLPVICFAGSLGEGYTRLYEKGFDVFCSTLKDFSSLEEYMLNAHSHLEQASEDLFKAIALGKQLP